jgi:hypothetical protein
MFKFHTCQRAFADARARRRVGQRQPSVAEPSQDHVQMRDRLRVRSHD